MTILLRRYCRNYTRQQLRIIATELKTIMDKVDEAYERQDVQDFRRLMADIRHYKPPFPPTS